MRIASPKTRRWVQVLEVAAREGSVKVHSLEVFELKWLGNEVITE
jgi:hypothetical protein